MSAYDPKRTMSGLKSRSAARSYVLSLVRAQEGSTALLRFRTIQVWPKDLSAVLQQVERAEDRQCRGGRNPDVRHEAARVHHPPQWRDGVAGRGGPQEIRSATASLKALRVRAATSPVCRSSRPIWAPNDSNFCARLSPISIDWRSWPMSARPALCPK